jgi:mannose-6-phosphate isomerase-like protein (cupin superfamily)
MGMNHIFQAHGWFTVPDRTDIAAFLNATDATNRELPWNMLGEMSIAAGRIAPQLHSWVHVHPVVTVVTYLLKGNLLVRMKHGNDYEPYDLQLSVGQAVVVEPGTLFQLRNDWEMPAEVLYIVSPSYVFENDGNEVRYDDAILVAESWDDLSKSGHDVPSLKISSYEVRARREESKRRLELKMGLSPPQLADETIRSLSLEHDYLAPDGSEIRLLVSGDNGGLAHCLLPAGKMSAAVRHRTVEELWYVLEGTCEIWRGRDDEPHRHDQIRAGDSLRIPVDTTFQFRAAPGSDLKLLLATMPPWPGAQEAVATSWNLPRSDER